MVAPEETAMTDDYETIYLTTATINSGEEQLEAALVASRVMLAALRNLTAWGCTWTGPRDSNSPHDLLVAAVEACLVAEAAGIRTEG